jgi:acyl carrier protein
MSVAQEVIFLKIKKILGEVLNLDEEIIKRDSKIINDLGAESLDLITLMMELEDAFNQPITDTDALKLVTVADVENFILQKNQELSLKT